MTPVPRINLKHHVEKGTRFALSMAVLILILSLLSLDLTLSVIWALILANWKAWIPVALVLFAVSPIVLIVIPCFLPKINLASLRGEEIEVGPEQMPEIYECASRFAQRLGLHKQPSIFVVQGHQVNAFAFKIRTRHIVKLNDSMVDACLRSGDKRTLECVLGHEMAHHALGHTNFPRGLLSMVYRRLSRLDELSADVVANELVGDKNVSAKAIIMLVVGPQIWPHINVDQLKRQAYEVANDRASFDAESYQTHPLLLRRLSRVI